MSQTRLLCQRCGHPQVWCTCLTYQPPEPTPPTPAGAGTETEDPLLDAIYAAIGKHENENNQITYCGVLAHSIRAVVDGYVRRQAEADRAILKEKEIAYDDMKRQRDALLSYQGKNFWIWQGDGCDNLESLTCPIMIKAAELRAIFAQLASADKDRERKPRRRLQLSLNLGADNRDELLRALDQIVLEMQMGHLWGDSCSGGCGSGYYMNVSEDESITHESYFAAIAALQPSPSIDQGGTGAKQP